MPRTWPISSPELSCRAPPTIHASRCCLGGRSGPRQTDPLIPALYRGSTTNFSFGIWSILSRQPFQEQPLEVARGLLDPLWGGEGVGPERFQVAFLFVIIERAVKTEGAGFGIINQAGGVV